MRTSLLKISADLENCTELLPLDTEEYPHDYGFTIECLKCKFVHPRQVLVNRNEVTEVFLEPLRNKSLRGRQANFFKNCKDCRNPMMLILEKPGNTLTKEDLERGNNSTILMIHRHGCRIRGYEVEDQFCCKTLTGEAVEEIDVRADWTEFDEINKVPMSITNFKIDLENLEGNSSVASLTDL